MIYRSLAETPDHFGPCAITIGNFDGVHCGHQQILRRVIAAAREEGWKSAVLTFDPHPAKLATPATAPRLLTTLEQRSAIILGQGIDEILILPFTPEIAALRPEDFAREILVDRLKARAVLVGANFHFGKRASGDAGMLEELGRRLSFETENRAASGLAEASDIEHRDPAVDRSGRRFLGVQNAGPALRAAGRNTAGEGRGSKLTVPTLNLDTSAEVLPKNGVYVTRTHEGGSEGNGAREWPSITNVGYRPTFNGHTRTIETYLLSPLDGPPPERISVELLRWVRDERKFENAEALKAQILRDVNRAQTYFRRLVSDDFGALML